MSSSWPEHRKITDYRFFSELVSQPFVEAIYLFGSRAKGGHESRSDIDLAILCPEATDKDWSRVMKIIEDADTLLQIDCVRLDTIHSDKFKKAIFKAHQLLYQRL